MNHNQINYLYFGGIFSLLVFIAAGSIFSKENLGGSQFFFFLYALGQVILETALFIFLGSLIRRYLGNFCFAIFIGCTFFAIILHALDFMMDRILDLSIWEAIRVFVLDESLDNFTTLLEASGIPTWIWLIIFASIAAIPLVGMLLYKMSDLIVQRRPFALQHGLFLQAFLCIPCALFFWDFSASKVIQPDAYTTFIKSLPWKFTFLHPQNVLLNLPHPLREPLSEEIVSAAIDQNGTVLEKKPNIYLFVIESLREDCITETVAPHLYQFKKTYSHFDLAVSNGNGTMVSWFSIFHSQFPYHWRTQQQHWKMGSPSLALLKKWGYKVRLYSSAHLNYYGMEELLFGDKLQLLDSRQNFPHVPPVQAAETDAAALAKLQKDLAEDPSLREGQVFIVFWDCTHFDYSWPKNWAPKFTPFAEESAYFRAFQSQKAIANIKNRYYNSINYMDSLFGSFFDHLPQKEEAIIAVMGDHGEEFFEHGHLFHNSHLVHEQTHVPLYLKFGKGERPLSPRSLASQMDVFPSILDYLGGLPVSFLEGSSLFQANQWPYAVTARFNAGRTPYEFCIHNGNHKLIAQFLNRDNIFLSKQIQLISLRTRHDKGIPELKNNVFPWVEQEFGSAFSYLLDNPSE